MLTNATVDGLHTLRLPGMVRGLLEQREHPDYAALGFEERLGMLVDRELTERANRKLERALKTARLRFPATIEAIDFRRRRGLERAQILSLAESHWVSAHQTIVIVGACISATSEAKPAALPPVSETAMGVAAARAAETWRKDRLFSDPLVAAFVAASGRRLWSEPPPGPARERRVGLAKPFRDLFGGRGRGRVRRQLNHGLVHQSGKAPLDRIRLPRPDHDSPCGSIPSVGSLIFSARTDRDRSQLRPN